MQVRKFKKVLLGVSFALVPLFGENFTQIEKMVNSSLKYKMAQKEVQIQKRIYEAAKKSSYGSFSATYGYSHLFNQPVMKTKMPVAAESVADPVTHLYPLVFTNVKAPLGGKENYMAEIKYSYPVFTGFYISSLINKEKIKLIQKELMLKNTKRVLILTAAKLYASIYSLDKEANALKSALLALKNAKSKALAFYKEGFTDNSQVAEIDAKYYEIKANLKNVNEQKKELLNTLSYLLNRKITSVSSLPELTVPLKPDIKNRADVMAVRENLNIAQSEIKAAKSTRYPKIAFEAGLKREADNFILTKNNYQNIDKSYIGLGLQWDYSFATSKKIEAAKIAKEAALIYYMDYLKKAKTDYENRLSKLSSLKYRLQAAVQEVKARREYFDKIKAKFNEGLTDSFTLSDAIAKLAASKAKRDAIKADIFLVKEELILNSGVKNAGN